MQESVETLPVTVDKSHLVTIGERLYGESIELIRELVNNAYDADATDVKITITEDQITVEDNGSGMDHMGLRQYFNIGSPEKRIHRRSPKFGRDRIGEFGIGKFAVLSASSYFEVWTRKDDFQARVVFDKNEWEEKKDRWHLPLYIEEPGHDRTNGTKVILRKIRKQFNPIEVERRLIETVPIKAADFNVYLNGRRIRPRYIPGQRIPFLEGTEYGIIHGEILISPQSKSDIGEAGVECKVRQVTIRREFFGLESLGPLSSRISGEVNADFLPITSDRTGFIKDCPPYHAFIKVMERVAERVRNALQDLTDTKENRKTKYALTEILNRVRKALNLNLEFCPEGLIPIGEPSRDGIGDAASVSETKRHEEVVKDKKEVKEKKKRRKRPQLKRLNPTAVVKRLDMGRLGVSCCIDHFGIDGPECLTEGSVVYINRDHPLFQKEKKSRAAFILYITRLMAQEICLMKEPKNPRQAFDRQSKLLKDALVD